LVIFGNLILDGVGVDVGYLVFIILKDGEDGLFIKFDVMVYLDYFVVVCVGDLGGKCMMIYYKFVIWVYIEFFGYDIVGNFGD